MQSLPVVDLHAADGPGAEIQARQLDRACREVGMFELAGHGIDGRTVAELFDVTRSFFDLPPETKATVTQPAADQVRGWSPIGSEGIAYSLDEASPADLKEKLDIGPFRASAGDAYDDPSRSGPHLAPNLWPDEPQQLRAVWERYYAGVEQACRRLMSLSARAWGLPPTWFDERTDRSISMLRGLHYPHQREAPLVGQLRAGAHTDYGAFTVITAEDGPGGLQMLGRDGGWVPVTTTPGRLVVGIGDLLAEWTADTWPATVHRVANPSRAHSARADSSRLAFAFYQHPNYDLDVDVLPPFRDDEWTAATPPLTAGEHLRQKYLRQTTFGRAE